jgi:hypothetical protein
MSTHSTGPTRFLAALGAAALLGACGQRPVLGCATRDEAVYDRGSEPGAATSEGALGDVADPGAGWVAWPASDNPDGRIVYWVMHNSQDEVIAIVTTELTDSGWFAVSRQDCH